MKKFFTIVLTLSLLCVFTGCGSDDKLRLISCPQQGFTTKADSAYPWTYEESTGINIWTGAKGAIPYVLVFQTDGLRKDSYKYFREKYTPSMRKAYGRNFVSATEYSAYKIGGKELPAALYVYRVNGRLIEMLRIEDNTGARTVQYTAKYHPKRECYDQEKNEEANTLAALDTAIRNFKVQSSSSRAKSVSTTSAAGNFKIVKATPKKISYEKYDDGLVSMDIPRGWKVIPHPKLMDAVHYAFQVVNPQNRDYQIFFNMKWEMGNLASEQERQWYAKNMARYYPQQLDFSKLPAIDPQTTEAFFKVWNANWSAMGGFKWGNFIVPKIDNFTVVQKLGTDMGGDVLRASFKNEKGSAVDGIFLAVLHKIKFGPISDVYGFPIVYVTAPSAEFVHWAPALLHCLETMKFSNTFTRNFNNQQQVSAQASAEIARIGNETSNIITKGWESRQKTYDVLSQKRSDATMGYERVYDTETGEIYRAYNGFNSDISTNNTMSERYKPITDDMYTKQVDGYIEK